MASRRRRFRRPGRPSFFGLILLSGHDACVRQKVTTAANPTSLAPTLSRTASNSRLPAISSSWLSWGSSFRNRSVRLGWAPVYRPVRPSGTVAPEHARGTNVTEDFGSLASTTAAAFAVPASALRWQRRFCQNGLAKLRLSGLPSPDATESPIETTSRSCTTTRSLDVASCPFPWTRTSTS